MSEPNLQEEAVTTAEEAVRITREALGINLDFSDESVRKVEEVLEQFSRCPRGGFLSRFSRYKVSDKGIHATAGLYGCYIGEVFRRRWGGEWVWDNNFTQEPIPALQVGGTRIFPTVKVYKRLTQGSDDDIWFYFQAFNVKFKEACERQRTSN